MKHLKLLTPQIPLFMLLSLSIVSWFTFHTLGLTLAYNDTMSHINLARFVVDNLEPGLAQIGGVWLPLTHLLTLTLVWNDVAWSTGLAASVFSMLSYILSVWGIYQILRQCTPQRWAAWVGALAFALNLNILYLQTTALTEPVYVATFVGSVWAFVRWMKTQDSKYIILLGFFGLLQILSRYDGWFVVGIEAMLLAAYQFSSGRRKISYIIGKLVLFSFPIAIGLGLWILWQTLIFGDPLYFAFGPHSARAQQTVIEESYGLVTKGDWSASAEVFKYDIYANAGLFVTMLSLLGLGLFIALPHHRFRLNSKLILITLLASPIIFNVLALYLGFSILNLPELNWNPSGSTSGSWFNVRYGVLALPAIAVMIGFLARRRFFATLAIAVIVGQQFVLYQQGIITIIDGTIGSSAFTLHVPSQVLADAVEPHQYVLMSSASFNPIAFKSGLQLNQFIHEGVSQQWQPALEQPQNYANWVVMASSDKGEPVYTELIKKQQSQFLTYYQRVYQDDQVYIYQLRPSVSHNQLADQNTSVE